VRLSICKTTIYWVLFWQYGTKYGYIDIGRLAQNGSKNGENARRYAEKGYKPVPVGIKNAPRSWGGSGVAVGGNPNCNMAKGM
jgi:hypothetical protein